MTLFGLRQHFEDATGWTFAHFVLDENEHGQITVGLAYYKDDELMIHSIEFGAGVARKPIEDYYTRAYSTLLNQILPVIDQEDDSNDQ